MTYLFLQIVFECFKGANLTMNLFKCQFLKQKFEYLSIQPGSKKINAVTHYPQPNDVHERRQFLGLANYFRKFVKNYATIALSLYKLLQQNECFVWNKDQDDAFKELTNILTSKSVLAIYDHKSETHLHTNASKFGIGSITLQKQFDNSFRPIV